MAATEQGVTSLEPLLPALDLGWSGTQLGQSDTSAGHKGPKVRKTVPWDRPQRQSAGLKSHPKFTPTPSIGTRPHLEIGCL